MTSDSDLIKRLVDCNFLDLIPGDTREKIKNARLKFYALKDELVGSPEEDKDLHIFLEPSGELFNEIYNRPGKVNRLSSLPADKRFAVIKITIEMLGFIPNESEKQQEQFGDQISKNQRRKENRKKYKKGKQRKRGGKQNKDDGFQNEKDDDKQNKDEGFQNEKNEGDVTNGERRLGFSHEQVQRKVAEVREEIRIANENDEAACAMTPEMKLEKLKADENRVEGMKRLVKAYEDVEDALIDLITCPFLGNRENTLNGFSNIIGNLIQPTKYSKENCEKVKGIVDMFSIPREDYQNPTDHFYDEDVREERCKEADIVIPSLDDKENFAKVFLATITSGETDNYQKVFEMSSIIAKEYEGNLLKQKVVEICMPDLLKILKAAVLSHELYMTELIFKVTMALPCARKYCWHDPEYFPTLSKLLSILDPNPELDKYQIRGDAVHILYMSILASPRDVYEKVAVTQIFKHLIEVLKDNPTNQRDAQTGEDVIMCITLFTEHWDLFQKDMKKYDVERWVQKWRRYALEYASLFPNFIWSLEHLTLRLSVLMKSAQIKEKKPDYRLQSPEIANRAREFIKKYNQTACSYPACYKLNDSKSENRYKKCARCTLSYYCSKECQVNHWKTHKAWCKPVQDKEKISMNDKTSQRKLANNIIEECENDCVPVQNTLIITEIE